MKISRKKLKKMTRERLRKRGLNYTRYIEMVGGEKRYFDFEIWFWRLMADINEDLVRKHLVRKGYPGL